jgi:MFS family permease
MTPASESRSYRAYVLFILVLVYTFNFIDRQIIGVLAPPIKAELHLSDTQLGLMGGPAFALFYTALGIPIAWLADRANRVWIMTAALALWSAFTAACGLTHSFGQLFIARPGVGVGEAGGVAPAYSLIADYFPPRERARALAIYSFGIPLGSALAMISGGLIASRVDWRWAFIALGACGLLIAPLFALTLKHPPRGRYDQGQAAGKAPLHETLGRLARTPSFWGLSFGAACSSAAGYGLIFWLPSFFIRTYHLELAQVSLAFAGILFFGGLAGIWSGGWLVDRLSARKGKDGKGRKGAYAWVPAVSFLVTVPFYVATILSPRPETAFLLAVVPQALALVWLGPILAAVQHLAPASMRATASASFLFINNLIGMGVGPWLFGLMSEHLKAQFGEQSLRYSILGGLGFYLAAAALLLLTARRLAKDWVD